MKEINNPNLLSNYCHQYKLVDIFDEKINNKMLLFEAEKGEDICREETLIDYVLFLVKGEVKIYSSLENGKSHLLRTEKPFSIYGDIELLTSDTYCANVEALKTCHLIGLPFTYVRKEYLNNAKFLKYLCTGLSHRLNSISKMSTEKLYLPLINKLAGYLIIYSHEASNQVLLKSSYTDISDQLGVTYRHLSRTFKVLEGQGLISKNGKLVTILNKKKLEDLAGSIYRYD